MKKFALGLLILLSTVAHATPFSSTKKYLAWFGDSANIAQATVYVVAVSDVYDDHLICVGDGVSHRAMYNVVGSYIKNNPEKLEFTFDWIVFKALSAKYPCKKKVPML